MFKLFKKKESSANFAELPPLPDELPMMDLPSSTQPTMQPNLEVPSGSIHDQIPNDSVLGLSNNKEYQATPTSLSSTKKSSEPASPSREMFYDQIPEMDEQLPTIGQPRLPPVPEIQKIQPVQNQRDSNGMPMPELESDDIPKPPAIFSDSSFYETPEELQHLVEPHEKNNIDEDFERKYNLSEASSQNNRTEKMQLEKPIAIQGPLFIDIESFKTMLKEVDTLKNNLTTSESIIAQLTDIKNAKDREIERWRTTLEDIQRKLNYVDKTLFNEA